MKEILQWLILIEIIYSVNFKLKKYDTKHKSMATNRYFF